ncbi:MAG TPA: MFS transporter, partial [Steroidobacteraceae bacterium]
MNDPTPTAAPLAVTAELVATAAPQDPWPSPRIAGYALFVFAIVLMFNFLDRGILNLLVTPIKRDLGLSDVQMSLLMGFAFSLFYVLLGLPIARLVDSRSRRLIMGTGIAIWSGMTALCGLAGNFSQLFIARVGVGVGEACNGPATYSMLSDLFPREKLPRAISFLNFGFVAGTGLALVIGGLVIKLLARVPEVHLPLIGTLHSWQLVFIVVGLPGLLVAALMATMPEPKRRGVLALVQGGRAVPVKSLPVKQVVGFLVKNGPAYAPMFMGLACSSVLNFGIQAWAPTLFARAYGWSASQAGLTLGILVIVTAPIGLLAGSALAERFARQGRDDANWRVVVIAMCL